MKAARSAPPGAGRATTLPTPPSPTADDPGDDTDDLLGEEPALDEAALREMIADIVREELQGSLGERITRNVRKLVRREIHRAMASYDLD